MAKVYLAGPMRGLSKEAMCEWRSYVAAKLQPCESFSPVRGFEHLLQDDGHMLPEHQHHQLRDGQALTRRDFWDVRRCDLLFCNFLGATEISVGTPMEISVAHELGKYIILVMESDNVYQHPMIRDCASIVVDNLDQAIEFARAALFPDPIPVQ